MLYLTFDTGTHGPLSNNLSLLLRVVELVEATRALRRLPRIERIGAELP